MTPISRRQFLTVCGGTALIPLFQGTSFAKEPGEFSWEQNKQWLTTGMLIPSFITHPLPPALSKFDNFKVCFISDIHNCQALDETWLNRIIARVNEEKVDLLTLGGDYIWVPDSNLTQALMPERNSVFKGLRGRDLSATIYEHLFTLLSRVQTRYGVYGVFGNHDRWISPEICREQFEKQIGKLLVNETVSIDCGERGTVELFGADDYWNGIPERPKFSSRSDTLKIILSHNPDHIIEECRGSIPPHSLALSGHTHGGQMRLPGIGALMYNIRSSEYGVGLHKVDNFSLYTTRGVGVVEIPYRINCPQEIVFITFSSAPAVESAPAHRRI